MTSQDVAPVNEQVPPVPPAADTSAPRAHSEGAGEAEPAATEPPAAAAQAPPLHLSAEMRAQLIALLQGQQTVPTPTAETVQTTAPTKGKALDQEERNRILHKSAKDPFESRAATLPKYDGSDYWGPKNGWLNWTEEVRNAARNFPIPLNEEEILALGRRALSGKALKVWVEHQDDIKTLDDLSPYMLTLMGATPLVDAFKRVLDMSYDGDMPAHEAEFDRYMDVINQEMLPYERLKCIMYALTFRGSEDVLWRHAGDAKKTFAETRQVARLAREELDQRCHANRNKPAEGSTSRWKRHRDTSGDYGSTSKGDYKRRHARDGDKRSRANNTPMGPIRCFNCHQAGHYATECTEPKN